jgi:hypothetical protein
MGIWPWIILSCTEKKQNSNIAICKEVSSVLAKVKNEKSRVVDPDTDWIRIQRLCGSGSVLGIQIQGQEN